MLAKWSTDETGDLSSWSQWADDDTELSVADGLLTYSVGPGGTGTAGIQSAAWEMSRGVVDELSTGNQEGTPEVHPDGLVMFFYRDPSGGGFDDDIFWATRDSRQDSWGNVQSVAELTTGFDEITPTLVWDLDRMLLCSNRRDSGAFDYDLYEATVDTQSMAYGAVDLVAELSGDGHDCSAHASPDGLTIFFASDRPGSEWIDLFTAERPSVDMPFGPAQRIEGVNSADTDTDPWISADGLRLYFARWQQTGFSIFMTSRSPL